MCPDYLAREAGVRFIIKEAYGALAEAGRRGNTLERELVFDEVRDALKG